MLLCRHCGAAVTVSDPIPRDAECAGCGRDLRACVQCRHYDPAYHNSCRETEAEAVLEKERRNFCEFFSFERGPLARKEDAGRAADARAKLEKLFGGKPGAATSSESARSKLEALFGGGAKPPGPPPDGGEAEDEGR
jgi:hypothetical protein